MTELVSLTDTSNYLSRPNPQTSWRKSIFEEFQKLLGVKEDFDELSTEASRFSFDISKRYDYFNDGQPIRYEKWDMCFVFRLDDDREDSELVSTSTFNAHLYKSYNTGILSATEDKPPNGGESLPRGSVELTRKSYELFSRYLIRGGCLIESAVSSDRQFVFLKCRLSEKACRHMAARENYKLQLDYNTTTMQPLKDDPDYSPPYCPYTSNAESESSGFACMAYVGRVWCRYDRSGNTINDVDYSANGLQEDVSEFRNVDRIRLLRHTLDSIVDLRYMLDNQLLDHYFVLHHRDDRRDLRRAWARYGLSFSTSQPINEIRNYYGERIAFYFLWIGYYARQLQLPAIIGTLVYFYQTYYDPDHAFQLKRVSFVTSFYAFYMVIWTAGVSADWEDIESFYRLKWGMEETVREKPRPEFKGDFYEADHINPTRLVTTQDMFNATSRRIGAWIASLLYVIGVAVSVAATLTAKTFVERFSSDVPSSWSRRMSLLINPTLAIQIILLDIVWTKLAYVLANFENHKFESDYTNSVIKKMVSLRFFNYFYSLLYTSYIKPFVDPCKNDLNCGRMMGTQMIYVFCVSLIWNAYEVGRPTFDYLWKKRMRETRRVLNWVEVQHKMKSYTSHEDYVEDFMEIMITFGFVAVFPALLPIIPLFALLCALIELRSDAFKITVLCQRPYPSPSTGLRSWNNVVKVLGYMSVTNNAALAVYRFNIVREATAYQKLIMFVILEHIYMAAYVLWGQWRRQLNSKASVLKQRMRMVEKQAIWGSAPLCYFASLDRGSAQEESEKVDVE